MRIYAGICASSARVFRTGKCKEDTDMDRKTAKRKTKKTTAVSGRSRFRVIYGSGSGRSGKRKKSGGLESLQRSVSKKKLAVAAVLLGIAVLSGGAALFVMRYFHVENIYVEGNLHYTSDEIIQMVTEGRLGSNSLYLSLKYRDRGIQGIPFIETMDVDVLSPDTIRITVYEKSIAGYVRYLDRYMYFDREGIVVEASETKTEGIPEITGIEFDQVILYEPLPVENQDVFRDILSITQILSKYGLSADKIYFDDSYEMTLYFGEIRARLGSGDNVEEKVSRLQQLLPSAEGKKGVFRLENYSGSGDNVSFELDE